MVTSCASCLPASSMLIVVMERFCGAYLSRRGVWCERVGYRALRVAGNCEGGDKSLVWCVYNRGPRITGRRNGEVAQGIFGDGVGGIDCGVDGGGCVAGGSY